jgi:2,4-dienoyl-CoA reductase-like NADH-dependent reductase (Old Yellow Enzyme family)/thioredoxin reductase
LQKLFEPTKIGIVTLKNRIVMPAMDTNLGSPDGSVSPKLVEYYEERAKGGVGLIIVQTTSVDYPRGRTTPFQISIDHDRYLPGLSQLAQAIKRSGSRAAIQLEDGGGITHSAITGQQPVGPSASISPLGEPIRELSATEIARLIERHAQAAARAQKAGFDAVEIHGGHEHLLSQFLSPYYNQRSDQYGGSLENRARFLLEVLRACRLEVGSDYPLLCRINGAEYGIDPSIDLVQTVKIAQWLEEAGVDAIDVTGHGYGVRFTALCPGMPGLHLAGAAEIKRNVKTPVIEVGRLYPELGEWALREGVADMIAMGRALIADPYLPKKAAEGRLEDIIPCIGCWQCLEGSIQSIIQAVSEPGSPTEGRLTCSVNPAAGREREYAIRPAPASKRVVVVGGGPAGMEAARVAKVRGHDVTLIERDKQLGGQLKAAAVAPRKETLSLLIDYFQTQLTKLGVRVELDKEATLTEIASAQPDVVVWAAGAVLFVPDIPGIDRANIVFASDVLTGKSVGGETVVIIGAETVGCETASFLADRGIKVTLVCRKPQALTKVGPIVQMELLEDLARKEVKIITGAKYEGFSRDGLIIRTEAGDLRNLVADSYVLATGARPNSELVPALKKKFQHVYVVGDSLQPRRIYDAISEGFETGRCI